MEAGREVRATKGTGTASFLPYSVAPNSHGAHLDSGRNGFWELERETLPLYWDGEMGCVCGKEYMGWVTVAVLFGKIQAAAP